MRQLVEKTAVRQKSAVAADAAPAPAAKADAPSKTQTIQLLLKKAG